MSFADINYQNTLLPVIFPFPKEYAIAFDERLSIQTPVEQIIIDQKKLEAKISNSGKNS